MQGYSIKEASIKLNISDKALYKRISNNKFNNDFIKKIDGKTIITEDGFKYLTSVVKKKNTVNDEVAATLQVTEKDILDYKDEINNTNIKVYTQNEIDIILMLRDHVEYLKSQLEQQSINYQDQLKIQAESYQQNLKIQLETIKSKESIIFNMQEIIKNEQENSRRILDYEDRAKEVDAKLLQLRQDLIERKSKKRKGLFNFLWESR